MKKAGYIAVIGRTNVGKSTLINKIIGQKINIVSPKQQTTRNNILGIFTEEDSQLVFIDTPGIHKSINQLDKFMSKSIRAASEGSNVVVYVLDGTKPFEEEELKYIRDLTHKNDGDNQTVPVIVAISKLDISNKKKLMAEMMKLNDLGVKEVIPISAEKGKNIDVLKEKITENLPQTEFFLFPKDEITDKPISFLCAEMIREKVLRYTNQEIPHGVMCVVTTFKENEKIIEIGADIICEKDSHKAIIIGKGGSSLKRIGTSARIDIEKLIGKKVMLHLFVKVEKDWRNNPNFLKDLGYRD
jgi:GTP-binding protein Era